MSLSDAGLGTVLLSSSDGRDITVRISMRNDSFYVSLLDGEDTVISLVIEDDYELGQLVSLLETCYNYI